MNNEEARMIVKLFNENPCNSYEETKSVAEIEYDEVEIRNVHQSCKTFNHIEEVAALAEAFRAHVYADIKDGQVIIRMF